jgi:high affinity sulfate transporter 1
MKNSIYPRLETLVPGLRVMRTYKVSWLSKDLAAGITLGLVMVPVGLAFGDMAGLPMAGLYSGMLPLIAYALFGSSRQVIIGTSTAMAALIAISVMPLAGGDAVRLAALAGVLGLLIGVLCIFGSLFRLGFLADLLARPVNIGFMHGLAIVIAVSQLPKFLGIKGAGDTVTEQFISVCRHLPDTNPTTLILGTSCLLIILSFHRWLSNIPGQIVSMVFAILVVYFLHLDRSGVAVLGKIPVGLPGFKVPVISFQDFQALIPIAFAAAFLAFSDTIVISRGFAARNNYRIDPNQELMALGIGNLAAGFTQSLVVSASGSRTATAEAAGSRTQLTSVVAAIIVACVMLFMTGLLYSLPYTALGSILIAAAWNLCDFNEFKRMWRFRRAGFIIALLTMAGIVGIGVIEGIAIGIFFSLVMVLKSLAFPGDAVLGRMNQGDFRDLNGNPQAKPVAGVIIYRFSGPLFFANCSLFHSRTDELIRSQAGELHGFILDASLVLDLDLSGCDTLGQLKSGLADRGIRLVIANLRAGAKEKLILDWGARAEEKGFLVASLEEAVLELQYLKI